MNQKEIKELIEFLIEKDIAEFELERGDVKVRIRRGAPEAAPAERIISVHPAPMSAMPVAHAPLGVPPHGAPPVEAPRTEDLFIAGQVLCIVEAMKLMNDIETDVGGEIVSCLVKNGQPIEYGQELFAIRPKK